MSREELRTFRYTCDGWSDQKTRCKSTRIIAAVNEDAADQKILTTGWVEAGVGLVFHVAWNRDPFSDWIVCSDEEHLP